MSGADQELARLREATVDAIGAAPNPQDLVSSSDAVNVVKAVAVDAAKSFLLGGDVGKAVRSSAGRKGRPQYEALKEAYTAWWRTYGPALEKATKAMNDALAHE